MKAAANGVVNLSVLDGWLDEGWLGDNGWAIGGREINPDDGAQDYSDAQDLLSIARAGSRAALLGRNERRRSRRLDLRDATIVASTIWRFSTIRMLHEYVEMMYCRGRSAVKSRPAAEPTLEGRLRRGLSGRVSLALRNPQPSAVGNFRLGHRRRV